jgi:aerobic carbon-monoxide dehydrogenase large subunit
VTVLDYRVEDDALLRGAGRYADDRDQPDALHAWIVRSPHAHARIRSVGAARARAAPRVRLVATGADLARAGVRPIPFLPLFKGPGGRPMRSPPRTLLQADEARYAGDPVALVIADSRDAARDAAELVDVDYEPLDAVTDAQQASDAQIAACAQWGDAAATDAAFARAAHVVAIDLVLPRVAAVPLEPRAVLAVPDATSGRVTLYVASQNPAATRKLLAEDVLGIGTASVRVRVDDIGGSFSVKTYLYPEDGLAAWAALQLGRPVRWRAERGDAFQSDTQGRDHRTRAELALDASLRFVALRIRTRANVGAYLTPTAAIIPIVAYSRVLTNTYDIPALAASIDVVLTNTVPVLAHRGAGRPEAVYTIERLVDHAARALGVDAIALRRRNLVRADAMPYRNAIGETYDSGDFAAQLERALELSDWHGFAARREASAACGRLRGRACASYVEWTGAANLVEPVAMEALADGRVRVSSGTQEMGQGLRSSYTRLLARALDVDPRRIEIVQGDTDAIAGGGSAGSRSLFVGGSALSVAAERLIAIAREAAAARLETSAADLGYRNGRFEVVGTDRGVTLEALAAQARLAVHETHSVAAASWPNGAHACEVEVDPETGRVAVARYTAVDDVGTVIDTRVVEGQVHGGVAQGVGEALLEAIRYDADSGQLLSGSLLDYALPRADDLPAMHTTLDEAHPCRTNALGAKGAGEAGIIASAAVVVNAVLDALAPAGVRHLDRPLTPETVWRALAAARR